MKHNSFLAFACLFSSFFILPLQQTEAKNSLLENYPLEKKVLLPRLTSPTEVRIVLDEHILKATNKDFSNFTFLDQENNSAPFRIFRQDYSRVRGHKIVSTSSQKSGKAEALIDDDVLSAFEFSERDDQGNASWVLVDLGQMMPINRVSIYTSAGSRIKNIDLKGGLHPQKLKTILSKRPINSPHFDFTSPLVRYVRVGFWGTKVKVDDIRFIGSLNGEAYLSAEPNTQYRLLYGSPEPLIQYKQQVKTRQTDLRRVNLARESQNKFFVEDFDGDGLSQANDNCPYVSNPSQWDTDKDKIGNKCDNAPKVKNYNQSDIDRDGIGDLADNCKLAPNPDQSNVDKDEYGDACDYAYGKEPLSSAEQASLNFKISIWGILILLFAGIITWQETKNKKISRWINKLKK